MGRSEIDDFNDAVTNRFLALVKMDTPVEAVGYTPVESIHYKTTYDLYDSLDSKYDILWYTRPTYHYDLYDEYRQKKSIDKNSGRKTSGTSRSYPIIEDTIWLYREKCHCNTCNSKNIKNKLVQVLTVDDTLVCIPVMHCETCDRFFMNYEQYKNYVKKGLPGNQFEFLPGEWSGISAAFHATSFLSEHGYRNTKNTPRSERWAALRRMINNGFVHWEIIEKIAELIALREGNPAMVDAIERYREDIDYVTRHRAGQVDNKVFKIKRG